MTIAALFPCLGLELLHGQPSPQLSLGFGSGWIWGKIWVGVGAEAGLPSPARSPAPSRIPFWGLDCVMPSPAHSPALSPAHSPAPSPAPAQSARQDSWNNFQPATYVFPTVFYTIYNIL